MTPDLPHQAIRAGRWKLLVRADGSGCELYDLETDPAERRDLAEQRPDLARRLAARAVSWREGLP